MKNFHVCAFLMSIVFINALEASGENRGQGKGSSLFRFFNKHPKSIDNKHRNAVDTEIWPRGQKSPNSVVSDSEIIVREAFSTQTWQSANNNANNDHAQPNEDMPVRFQRSFQNAAELSACGLTPASLIGSILAQELGKKAAGDKLIVPCALLNSGNPEEDNSFDLHVSGLKVGSVFDITSGLKVLVEARSSGSLILSGSKEVKKCDGEPRHLNSVIEFLVLEKTN